MTDAHHDFATLCANVIADVAANLDADEALASVEHHCGALHGPYRYAGQAIARSLYAVARHDERPAESQVDDCLRWARWAASWPRLGDDRGVWVAVGTNLERARAVVDGIECRELVELLRLVIEAVRVQTEGAGRGKAA